MNPITSIPAYQGAADGAPKLRKKIIQGSEIAQLSKALASKTRQHILALLKEEPMDVSTLANKLEQTEANVSAQVQILQKAGLVTSTYKPGNHGVRKVCEPAIDVIEIVLHSTSSEDE
ncbi:MAG: ArsR family transcriptional regulator [Promethearchaeota archaeon CR_4]|nr:MAG: ArsR family transcriptional regulator [Candidatus Lokiarchaeota archaeon CR_4]